MEHSQANPRELEPHDVPGRRPLSVALGQRLRELREAKGWSQDALASIARGYGLNWTRSALAKVERGERRLSLEEFLLLPGLMGVPLTDLFDGADEWVELAPGAAIRTAGLNRLLKGASGKLTKSTVRDLDLPWQRQLTTLVKDEEAGFAERVVAFRDLVQTLGVGKAAEEAREVLGTLHAIVEPEVEEKSGQAEITLRDRQRQDRGRARVAAARRRMERLWPDGDLESGIWAELIKPDDATQKAARRLGLNPQDLTLLAFRLWDHDLTSERERRLSEQQTESGDISARRGHVTRALLKELKAVIPELRSHDPGLVEGAKAVIPEGLPSRAEAG